MKYPRWIILQCIWLVFSIIFPDGSKSQEMWGITASNYAGSSGVLINPTSILTSKLYADINILSADFFFENNYAYIHRKDYSLFKYLTKNPQLPKYGPDDLPFDHYTDKHLKYFYASELIKGPSAMIAVGRHAFAVHTGARVLLSGSGIPYDIANFGYYGLKYTPQQNINYSGQNLATTALVMGEVGLTYAYEFRKTFMEDWLGGVTVKRLFAYSGAYMQVNDENYIVLNDSSINIKNLNAEVGYSLPLDYNNNNFPDGGPLIKGSGFGFDIGLTFQDKTLSYQKRRVTKLCSQKYVHYIYRVGVSLLDVGYVNFSNNAQVHTYDNVSKYWISIDTLTYDNLNQLTRTLSQEFYGNPDESYSGNKIRVYLPTAFSVQGDYRIHQHWYAGGIFIHPVRLGKAFIRRPAQIALIPRYETAQFEAALPVSLYDYTNPRVGFSVRYHFLTIGTDEILGLLGLTNITGLDFYFSVKINFSRGNCGHYRRNTPCENQEYGIKGRQGL